ncbi:MAG: polysaccharide deacetylase family protein [Kofleriaceae bacterium]|nr:MAG: polysaccharide deacetylase family protein [Kofleriaceae bacterium]MBZ0238764.1 polysaccharide deacetylase family protein [Kofleriaceae bacterium]
MYRILAAALAVVLGAPTAARADGWPAPAAGLTRTGDPEVIFTFDDGPDPRTTERVLDTLKQHKIHAIFFMVGWRFQRGDADKSRLLVDRILDEGHVIANHTITHAQLCGLEPEGIDQEIAGARDILEREARMSIPWFRTPYGAHCNRLLESLGRNGLTHFHWDIDPQEWQGKSAKSTAAYVIKKLARLDGRAVLLMHDTKPATVAALPEILAWMQTENARRKSIGRRQIRVISGPELAAERARPTLEWLGKATSAARDQLAGVLSANVP